MNTTRIDTETWELIKSKYPGAYAILLHNSLVNEKRSLEYELDNPGILACRKAWIIERLRDLNFIQ